MVSIMELKVKALSVRITVKNWSIVHKSLLSNELIDLFFFFGSESIE